MRTFKATYQIEASTFGDAESWAHAIAREQTIECIDEGVPHAWILEEVLGKVINVSAHDDQRYLAEIAYNSDVTGDELPQMLNVVYGNTAIHVGVKLVGLELPPDSLRGFPGPRFGIEGVRRAVGAPSGPLICTVLKPMGLSPEELGELAYQCVLGGVDLMKDDHSLAMQHWAPFEKRVEAITKAVDRANRETGRSVIYCPSLLSPIDKLEERARFAKQAGAGGYLIMPGHTSWDSVRFIASSDELSLPIMCHPSGIGGMCNSPMNGLSHSVMYAAYPRLAGADVSIYPSFGGRYGFSKDLCVQVAEDCRDLCGIFKPILPSPGGGMKLELAAMLHDMYGDDAVFLFGGAAMQYRDKIADGIRVIRDALDGSA